MKENILNVKASHDSETVEAKVTLTDRYLIIQPFATTRENPQKQVTEDSVFQNLPGNKTDSKTKENEQQASAMPANTTPRREQRKVEIKRQAGGGLGISVKGGSEHGIPVLISKVFPGQAADQTKLLFPGDAIIAVNDTIVERMKHDDVVAELRKHGENVVLTVREFDGASHILRTASTNQHNSTSSEQPYVNIPMPSSQTSMKSETISVESSQHNMQSKNSTSLTSQSNGDENIQQSLKLSELKIPLLMARVSTYQKHSDTKLINQIEISSSDDKMRQIIIFKNNAEYSEWLDELVANICNENSKYVTEFNDHCKSDNSVHMLGWLSDRNIDANNKVAWNQKFVMLQGQRVKIYKSSPMALPGSELPSSSAELEINLFETLFRTHTTVDKLLDKRRHCFSVQYSTNQVIYCSVNNNDELKTWSDAYHSATHKAVYAIQTKTYFCTWEDRDCELTIDFEKGFILRENLSKDKLWAYKFSQLKSSSDDGKTTIHFTFLNNSSFEKQDLNCENAYQLLFCVHAFLEAKIAKIDPEFLANLAKSEPGPKRIDVNYSKTAAPPKTPMAPRLVLDGKSPS